MNFRPKASLAVIAVLLSLAIVTLPALTQRLIADSTFLPLVANGPGTGNGTPTLLPTLPVDPTEQALTATAAATLQTPPSTDTPTATPTSTEAPTTTVTVTLSSNLFSPAAITIHPGDTVVWVRQDGFHNVRAVDNSFRLGENAAGDPGATWISVSHTFTQAGTFAYYCEIHGFPNGSGMAGTVTVQSGN